MSYLELIVLLPCHSLEDFPTYLEEVDANGLLAACTALWHPALIQASRKLPTWCRADVPPLELAGRLLVVPQVSEGWMACDFLERAKAEGAVVLRGANDRAEIVAAALADLTDAAKFEADVVADFFALGFCRWHVELITRVMRYTSTLDEIRLQTEVLAALDAALVGDRAAIAEALQRSFDQLCESRRYFYPVDPYVVDLTLVAKTTIGDSLRSELMSPVPKNLLLCGKVLEQMTECETASVDSIKAAIERNEICLVGGEHEEREFPLLPEETWREDLLRGIATYERILNRRPIVYGRHRAGLSPLLPQLLCRTGFQAALHFTLDDGQFPTSPNAKVRWDSPDGSVVEAIAQVPFDAAKSTPFLELPRRLGEAMDREQVATLVFAHWPGMSSIWYDDLRRVARYTPALGKFIKLDDYFSETVSATNFSDFKPDDYRTPYLRQGVWSGQADPISTVEKTHRQEVRHQGEIAWEMLERPLFVANPQLANEQADFRTPRNHDPTEQPAKNGVQFLLVNPASIPIRRKVIWSSSVGLPDESPNIIATDLGSEGTVGAVAVVPGMGFAWVTAGTSQVRAAQAKSRIADGLTLRNEFCEVMVHPETGGIQATRSYSTRGNRLSQQVVFRRSGGRRAPGSVWRDPDEDAVYSIMVADSIRTDVGDGVEGRILSEGRLVDAEGHRLAGYRQSTSLMFGSRIIEVSVELDLEQLPEDDPWSSYYAFRFALPDVETKWHRSVGLEKHETSVRRIEAPSFLEISTEKWSTAILTGGLPYHRRSGRILDTILVVKGESQRRFSVAIVLDAPNLAVAASEYLALRGGFAPANPPAATAPKQGWFFHIDAKGVIATHWSETPDGSAVVVRLRETAGMAGPVRLRSWRPIRSARQTDFLGNTLCELAAEHDKISIEMNSYQWIQVEAVFA